MASSGFSAASIPPEQSGTSKTKMFQARRVLSAVVEKPVWPPFMHHEVFYGVERLTPLALHGGAGFHVVLLGCANVQFIRQPSTTNRGQVTGWWDGLAKYQLTQAGEVDSSCVSLIADKALGVGYVQRRCALGGVHGRESYALAD